MSTVLQDLRFALRLFTRNPWFTLVALLPLALGIGANAAVLGLVDALLVRPVPGITGKGVVRIIALDHGRRAWQSSVSYPELEDLRRGTGGVFEEVTLFRDVSVNLRASPGHDPLRAESMSVTGNYFSTLGVRPALGRWFLPEEDRTAGTHRVAVISHALWQAEFAGDPGVLGRRLEVNGVEFAVVGVAPPGFVGCELSDDPPAIWVPVTMHATLMPSQGDLLQVADYPTFEAVARLRPGATAADATVALARLVTRWNAAAGVTGAGARSLLAEELRGAVHPFDQGDVVSLAGVAFLISAVVLLIACANVGGLLVGRATVRGREIGIRLALGAGRGRLVRQLLTESLLLAVMAGGLGLLLASWTTGLLVASLGLPFGIDVRPDAVTLAGTLAVSVVAAVLFGLTPALHAAGGGSRRRGHRCVALLAEGVGAGGARGRARLRRGFAVAQVALSLALLATAGLLLRSVQATSGALRRDTQLERVLTASLDLSGQGYGIEREVTFGEDLLARLRAMPGVEAASLGTTIPGRSTMYNLLYADGRTPETTGGRRPFTRVSWVWPGYFRAAGEPLTRGRDFGSADRRGAPRVAVVNEALAREFWGGQDPVGKALRLGSPSGLDYVVVGVVRERERGPGGDGVPGVYFARLQQAEMTLPTSVVVRAAGPSAAALAPGLRRLVRELDPALPLFEVATLRQVLDERLRPKRAASAALNAFGGLALFLASIGVYGLIAWMVGSRQREIGVRMALGATRRQVLSLVLAEGARIALLGGTIGLALAGVATRLMSGLVAGAVLGDLAMFATVAGIVAVATAVASCVPAWRATRVDPAVILRAE